MHLRERIIEDLLYRGVATEGATQEDYPIREDGSDRENNGSTFLM